MDTDYQLKHYERTIRSVETESCDCGGTLLRGDEWRSRGCGWSPEYLNDLGARELLESERISGNLSEVQLAELALLDDRLKVLLVANGISTSGATFWRNGLPRGIAP